MKTTNLKQAALHCATKSLPLLITLLVSAQSNAAVIRATVNGVVVSFPDVQPIMMHDRVMVPIRGVFEHMNARVEWDEPSQSVSVYHGADVIRLTINKYTGMMNNNMVSLDAPAVMHKGRTMVPLRFLSQAMHSNVDWMPGTQTVQIVTEMSSMPDNTPFTPMSLESGIVIPFSLSTQLSSNGSKVGTTFTAMLDSGEDTNYQGIPKGSILEGHVDIARPKVGDAPGVLGMAFDLIRLPDNRTYPINGTLIGLDSDSVTNEAGKLTAKKDGKTDNLKYLGYGAGGGALVAILTKGNIITDAAIGGALGYLLGTTVKPHDQTSDVVSYKGTKFGVKLLSKFNYRVTASL